MNRLSNIVENRFRQAANYLSGRLIFVPDATVIAGSGLSGILGNDPIDIIHYDEIPGFPETGVEGHAGEIIYADISGRRVIIFSGRIHLYEGRTLEETLAIPIVSSMIGIKNMVITHAAGALNPGYRTGDIMLIKDSINFTQKNSAGLFENLKPEKQFSFFDKEWSGKIEDKLTSSGTSFHKGTCMQVSGPGYESRAEIRMFRKMGADSIGMSTVIEAENASLLGMNVCGCSFITNTLSDTEALKLKHSDVLKAGEISVRNVTDFVLAAASTLKS